MGCFPSVHSLVQDKLVNPCAVCLYHSLNRCNSRQIRPVFKIAVTHLSSFSSAWIFRAWYLCSSFLTRDKYSWAHFFKTSSFWGNKNKSVLLGLDKKQVRLLGSDKRTTLSEKIDWMLEFVLVFAVWQEEVLEIMHFEVSAFHSGHIITSNMPYFLLYKSVSSIVPHIIHIFLQPSNGHFLYTYISNFFLNSFGFLRFTVFPLNV